MKQNIWDQALKDAATSKYDFTEARLKLGLHRCHMALEAGKAVLFQLSAQGQKEYQVEMQNFLERFDLLCRRDAKKEA